MPLESHNEKAELCVVCGIRPAVADGLCGPCYRWEK